MEETLNNKVRVASPNKASEYNGLNLPKNNRYKWLSLDLAEPNLGVPNPERVGGSLENLETVLNAYNLSAVLYPTGYVEGESSQEIQVYTDLKIDIHLDLSSVNITFLVDPALYGTVETLAVLLSSTSPLRQLLLPFYGGNETLMLNNVRITTPNYSVSDITSGFPRLSGLQNFFNVPGGIYTEETVGFIGQGERTLLWSASSLSSLNPSNRKIVFNFCDEASSVSPNGYYGNNARSAIFNPLSALKSNYLTDYGLLSSVLQSRRGSTSDTKVFDVCVGRGIYSTYWADAYLQFLNVVKNGGGNYNVLNFSQYDEYQIDSIARGGTLSYYANYIMTKLKEAGYSYTGSSLADNYYVTSNLLGERGFDAFPSADSTEFKSDERPDLGTLEAAIDELLYISPKLTTFTLNNSGFSPDNLSNTCYVVPKQIISPALLRWETNKKTNAAIDRYELTLPSNQVRLFRKLNRYDFKNIVFSVSGSNYTTAPTISTVTINPLSTFEPADLRPIMGGVGNTQLVGISVVDPGEYATYDINVLFLSNGGSPTPPVISTLGLNEKASAPQTSFNLGSITVATELSATSSFKLKAIDWKGNSTTQELIISPAAYIYYGVTSTPNVTASDIINGTDPGRGGLRRLSKETARSYAINASSPNGLFYYIAYPDTTPNPNMIVQGFPVQNNILTNIVVPYENRPDLPPTRYNVTISNNRQRGSFIPINVS